MIRSVFGRSLWFLGAETVGSGHKEKQGESQEAIAVSQVSDDHAIDQNGDRGDEGKCLGFGYILEVEPTGSEKMPPSF